MILVMAFWTKTEGGDRFDKGLSIGYFLVMALTTAGLIFKTIQEAS